MKLIKCVLLILAVDVTTSAFIGEDSYIDDQIGESLELDEREPQINDIDPSLLQNVPSSTANRRDFSCIRQCTRENTIKKCARRFLKICVKWTYIKQCLEWRLSCSGPRGAKQQRSFDGEEWKRGINNENPLVAVNDEQADGVAVAAMNSDSFKNFRYLYNVKVVKAQKYEADSEDKKMNSVVITLADGRRFEVLQGRELSADSPTAMFSADGMTDVWKLTESKDIQFSTVLDYIKVSDSSTSAEEAVNKMIALS